MPELPEVETTRRGLVPHLAGRRICGAVIRNPDLRWRIPPGLDRILNGLTIAKVLRRGKYLLLECSRGAPDSRQPKRWGEDGGMVPQQTTSPSGAPALLPPSVSLPCRGALIVHLGMSGSLRIVPASMPVEKHDHFDLILDGGELMRLRDPRRFGSVLWETGNALTHPLLVELGPEPLTDDFNAGWLYRQTRSRSAAIKQVLMDSHVVAGVGNIYANEALFRAGINPKTAARRVGLRRCEQLVQAVKETLRLAISAGGSTLRDFVSSDGKPGYFQQQCLVYGRAGEPCRRCGTPIRLVRQGQRSSFYCPRCQK